MKSLFTIVFGGFFILFLQAQPQFPTGLVLDDEEYESLSFESENIKSLSGQKYIESQVDLSAYCPEIRHQGEISSCVGWSAGYGAMTIEMAIKNGWKDKKKISENAYSALFVYNQISDGNCNAGITMTKALKLLQNKGNCLARDFDFDVNDCGKEVPQNIVKKAEQFKIDDYIPLFKTTADEAERIRAVKMILAQQKPVVIGMTIQNNFRYIRPGDTRWLPNIGDTTYAGGHAMVVVGYDDHKFSMATRDLPPEEEGAFKLMNSWGKTWGENGFIWVSYANFAKYCRHAYAIMLPEGTPIDFDLDMTVVANIPVNKQTDPEIKQQNAISRDLLQLSGAFGFRHYKGWDHGHVFEEAPVQFSDGKYSLTGNWKIGDQFQLYIKSGFENGYIYVFSIDAIGKGEVHFPRSHDYNKKFEGENESALIFSSGSLLTIPGEDRVLELSQPGKDWLVALFSINKIKPEYINLLLKHLTEEKGDVQESLLKILEKHMIPASDINFDLNSMGFEVSSRSSGKIVPIILEVSVK